MLFREAKNKGLDNRLFGTIINLNEESPYQNLLDMYVIESGVGEAVMEVPAQQEHLNTNNIVHGGVAFSLADTAMGFAIATLNIVDVTVDSNISYLKPGYKSDTLRAVGKVVKTGKNIIFTQAEIYNQKKELIATATGTYFNMGQLLEPVKY